MEKNYKYKSKRVKLTIDDIGLIKLRVCSVVGALS